MIRRLAMWLVMRGPRWLSPIAPWLFGFAIGSRPRRVQTRKGNRR